MTRPRTTPARSRRSTAPTVRSNAAAGPTRSVVDPGRPPMTKRQGLIDFLMALGFFVGLPLAITLFARLVLGMD